MLPLAESSQTNVGPTESWGHADVRRAVKIAALMWAVTRVLFFLVALVGSYRLPSQHQVAGLEPHPYVFTTNRVLDTFVRWDAVHYLGIAEGGYQVPGWEHRAAFFPLWPMMLRGFTQAGLDPVLVGTLLNHFALLMAMVILVGHLGTKNPWFLSFVVLFSPATFYYSALYPESLFFLCAVAVLVFGRRYPFLAAASAAFASALRPQGILLAMFLLVVSIERRSWKHFVAAGIGALGLLSYMGYLYQTRGDAIAFLHAQAHWKREVDVAGPWTAFLKFDREPDHYVLALLGIYLVVQMIKRKAPYPETLLGAALLAMPLSTGTLLSLPRFFLGMVPLHAELAETQTPKQMKWAFAAFAIIYSLVETYRLGRGWPFL